MTERNCKKCFHYKACKEVASHSGYSDISYTESQCKHFTPTADVAEVKRGEWKFNRDGSGTCDQCGITQKNVWDFDNYQNHCGHCGARMDGTPKEREE